MKNKTAGYTSLVLSLLLALGVMTVFRACAAMEDGGWMHCHSAQTATLILALAMAALSVAALLFKRPGGVAVLSAVNALLAVAAAVTPGRLVSLCMMRTMRCQSVMRPFVLVMGILIAAVSLLNAAVSIRAAKRR